MKLLFCLSLALLFLTGCSSTYWLNQSTSKSKYYEDFNKSVVNKNLEITLENDSTFFANEGAKIINDTLLINTNYGVNNLLILPINKVKEVSYKNHWLGVLPHLAAGTGIGIILGGLSAIIYDYSDTNDKNNVDYSLFMGISAIGLVAGSIWGYIDGYTYTYQFNP